MYEGHLESKHLYLPVFCTYVFIDSYSELRVRLARHETS